MTRQTEMSQSSRIPSSGVFVTPAEMFTKEPRPFDDQYAQRCLRVLRMALVLHGKGFHGLRVFPYEYPLAYRIELFPSAYADPKGIKYNSERLGEQTARERLIARHSGASGEKYFGWDDVAGFSAEKLALVFIERFPALARATYHLDFAYVGWFATLFAHCQYGFLPYLFAEYEDEGDFLHLRQVGNSVAGSEMDRFPLPPSPSGGSTMHPHPAPEWL